MSVIWGSREERGGEGHGVTMLMGLWILGVGVVWFNARRNGFNA